MKIFRLNVTPRTLIESTLVNPETVDGSPAVRPLPLGLTKIISADFERFNFRLLLSAQVSTLLTSAEHDWILFAGMSKDVSSACRIVVTSRTEITVNGTEIRNSR